MKKELTLEKQYEKLLNIRTTGRDDTNSDTYRYPYEPTPYCVLERLAASGYIGRKNTLLDYGCGKGRVEIYMSYQTGCKTIGIEYDKRIFDVAEENRKKSPSGRRTELINEDATTYEIPKAVDRIFFFNPFSVELLRSVLGRISESVYENPREILLFFYFPSDEYVSCLMTCEDLEFYDEIECDDLFDGEKERERILIFRAGER